MKLKLKAGPGILGMPNISFISILIKRLKKNKRFTLLNIISKELKSFNKSDILVLLNKYPELKLYSRDIIHILK